MKILEIIAIVLWFITGLGNLILFEKISKFNYGVLWFCLMFNLVINAFR